MRYLLSLPLLLTLFTPSCRAQTDSVNKISIGLELIAHGETCGGGLPRTGDGDKAAEDRSHFLFGRTRINVDYERQWLGASTSGWQPALQVHTVLQNKAVWGMDGNQTLGLYEGWAKMTFKNGLFAQVGRVALAYDDERIIGTNDFATAANSHDVIRLGYEGHGHQAHVILAYNQNGDNVYDGTYYVNGAQLYKTMQTVWYHYDVPKFPLGASLLFMNVGLQAGITDAQDPGYEANSARTEYQQMFGGYVTYHPGFLKLEASYYRQTGKLVDPESMVAKKIRAWMAGAKATVMPNDRYGVTVGYDYMSGDDFIPNTYGGLGMVYHDVFRGFTPLYGSRTKFYGILDYYYESAYLHGFTPGLQNAYIGLNAQPVTPLTCSATYHYLAVATKLQDLNSTLGHSIDLQASYQFAKDISLSVGYTLMFGTETMDRLKQGDSSKRAHWGWFSLAISPSLFTTKW